MYFLFSYEFNEPFMLVIPKVSQTFAEWSISPGLGPDGQLCCGKRKTKAAASNAVPA